MDSSALTEKILTLRKETDAFQQSISSRSEKLSYTFYDGPPFTSGDPHYGHLLQSIVKDMVPRWMTMRGYRVNRKWGWDCHGIPAENFVNKKLGITSKKQVEEEFGLQNYIESCRSMVNQVNDNRKWTIDRIGRWVDMENAYFTMDNDFMESVICLFSDLYHRNLIYKGFKVLGYSRALGTALSNSEIAEGYEMRQDPAVTVKFPLKNNKDIIGTTFLTSPDDDAVEVVVGVLKDDQGRILMIYKNKDNMRYFPGGKIEQGEVPVDALKREILEELGTEVTSEVFLGHAKTVHRSKIYRLHFFEITVEGIPSIQEPQFHGMMEWIQKIPSENDLGYVLKFADIIIADVQQLRHDFTDIHILEDGLIGMEGTGTASVSILPWTTTPWTLPANMFAAVHRDITYIQIFDKEMKEYYILAQQCLSKYYKTPEEYVEVTTIKGSELVDILYTPLFNYYASSQHIDDRYKQQVHKILHADFVTIESGTGIVHEAPAFGADDYELVAGVLGKDNAQEWLFDPVNEYGEFTSDAPNFVGQNVIEANQTIIKELKGRGLLVKQETINHSYPHCPRTKTPLIYKAIESWFVKEEELKALTVPAAEQIHFVPETVKQRFINGLASAPDRNISRTRFWGAPLPVWESEDGSETLVVGSKEEIYQYSKTGSKNLTKFVIMRHGEGDHNVDNIFDSCHYKLNETGKKQAIAGKDLLTEVISNRPIIIISPVYRCLESIIPYLETIYDVDQMEIIVQKYSDVYKKFSTMYDDESIISFIHSGTNELLVHLYDTIYVDYRVCEILAPSINGQKDTLGRVYTPTRSSTPVAERAESLFDILQRTKYHVDEMIERFSGEEIVVVGHTRMFSVYMKHFEDFDYETQQKKYRLKNCEARVLYYDANTKKEMDLHRPYIDAVWFEKDAKKYSRIPEVLDCWFESGSMPYGQDHFMKGTTHERVILVDAAKGIINSDDEYSLESFSLNREFVSFLGSLPGKKIVVTNTSGEKRVKMEQLLDSYDFDFFTLENSPNKSDPAYFVTLLNQYSLNPSQVLYFDHQISALDSALKNGIKHIFHSSSIVKTMNWLRKEFADLGNFNNCANFIAEGLDQTRGWFRALHVLGHAYHGQNVFQHVVVTGMILAEDGKKMSKSLQNYPDPTLLINQYGADALRLYLLSSPVVRAEPLRFSEKGVEQMLKDVIIPLQNVFNFFKLYAQVDQWKDSGTQVWFMRHALKQTDADYADKKSANEEGEALEDIQRSLSEEGFAQLTGSAFIEQVVRIDPEVIVCSDFLRTQQTSQGVQTVLRDYLGKEIIVEATSDRGFGAKPDNTFDEYNTKVDNEYADDALEISQVYKELLEKHAGKRILIVSHKRRFRYLRQWLFGIQEEINSTESMNKYFIESAKAVPLPLAPVANELDQRVLAELHRTVVTVSDKLHHYYLEEATSELMNFVDNLTNRYLRRSRRRFWSEAMTEDKQQAYQTLFTVLRTYLQLCAPFIPFLTEELWQELYAFTQTVDAHPSIHLQAWPVGSQLYINQELIDEIVTVRKIIKGALYLRAKHQVKVKQPLPSLSFRV